MSRLTSLIATFCWLTLFASGVTSLSAADVEVRLTDGRTLRGSVVESQTNKEQLALEQRSSGITIRRTLTWNQIADCKIIPPIKKYIVPAAVPQQALNQKDAAADNDLNPLKLPVSQLLVKADPISRYFKMDWDALRLTLRGVNEFGDEVPLKGTLYVTLWGPPRARNWRHRYRTATTLRMRRRRCRVACR